MGAGGLKVAPRLKYPLDACPPVRSDRLAKRQALDGHEQRAAQLLRRTDFFFSLRIILIPISSASEIQSAKIGTLYNRSVEGPVAHSLAVGRPDSVTAFSRGRDKWCHIKRVRELPFMTSTKFWDFLTPSHPLCQQNQYCLSANLVYFFFLDPFCLDVIYGSPLIPSAEYIWDIMGYI